VIADAFENDDIERLEQTFEEGGFRVHKKEVLNFNVKHAMQLDKPRVQKLIASITSNAVLTGFLRNFFAIADESQTYRELGKTKGYICYVLRLADYDMPTKAASQMGQSVL